MLLQVGRNFNCCGLKRWCRHRRPVLEEVCGGLSYFSFSLSISSHEASRPMLPQASAVVQCAATLFGLCLGVPSKPQALIGGSFPVVAGSSVCNPGIKWMRLPHYRLAWHTPWAQSPRQAWQGAERTCCYHLWHIAASALQCTFATSQPAWSQPAVSK